MTALSAPINHTVAAIDEACAARALKDRRESTGINMSTVSSTECDRALWYTFRWAHDPERIEGRKQRIFDTGNVYERRLLDYLRSAGVDVVEVDEATGQQFRALLADGWLRGYIDGIANGVPEAPSTTHIVECKTHNAKSFAQLTKAGVKVAKPEHYSQCQLYMYARGLTRALYLAVCKDDDAIYAERIEFDPKHALAVEARVGRIVAADEAPARFEGHWCSWCKARSQCLDGAWARSNCRTCLHWQAVPGGNARCAKHDRYLSTAEQAAGCGDHRYLPSLVPGEQVDVIDGDLIAYRLPDGTTWIDGQRETA